MNINFEDIITKANDRKEALMKLQTILGRIDEVIEAMEFLADWHAEFHVAYKALDYEGKELIPEKMKQACKQVWAPTVFKERLDNTHVGQQYGLRTFKETK